MIRRRLHPLLYRSIRLSVPVVRHYISARSLAAPNLTAHAVNAVRKTHTRSSSCLAATSQNQSSDISDDDEDDESSDDDDDGNGSEDSDDDDGTGAEDGDDDDDDDMSDMDSKSKYERAGPDPGQIVSVSAELESKLSKDIITCNTAKDVETVLQSYVNIESIPTDMERWKRVSPSNAVAAFRSLAEKRTKSSDWEDLDADFRVNLVTRIQLIIPLLESRHIVTCIWVVARFNGSIMKHPLEQRLIRLLCGAIVKLSRQLSAVEISTTMWSLATIEEPNSKRPLALETLQERINNMHVPTTFQEHEYSNLVWSMPSLQLMFVTSTKLAEDLTKFAPTAFTTAELASIAMGISKTIDIDIEVRKAALFNIIERAETRIAKFKQQSLCDLCWALANRRIHHPTIYAAIADAVVKLDPPLKNRTNAMNLVWSYTQVSRYFPEMFAHLSLVLRDDLKELERADFRSLLVAYSHADVHDQVMIDNINAELQRRKDKTAEIVAANKAIRLKKEEEERQAKIAKNKKKMKAKSKRRKAAKKLKEAKLKERREKHTADNWNFSQFMDF